MSDTTPTHRLSGGEMEPHLKARYLKLHRLIERADDVHAVLALQPRADGTWLYLIQTPFATLPKFVIGATDDGNTAPELLYLSGAEWSARAEWERLWKEEDEA